MENKNPEIGTTITDNGKTYEVKAALNLDCNACKGCGFYETVNSSDEFEGKPIHACSSPVELSCMAPDRIFVELKNVPA